MLDYCIKKVSEMKNDRHTIYAVVTNRRGDIIGEAVNSYSQTHPVQKKYASRVGKDFCQFLHAEIGACIKALRHPSKTKPHAIFIARVHKNGKLAAAAPCPICSLAIFESGISHVEHT